MMNQILQTIVWYLEVSLIGLLIFPVAYWLFPRLSTRGYAIIRPLGLLVWGYIFWLLTSLGVLQNDAGGELVALLGLVGISLFVIRKVSLHDLVFWFRANWRTVLAAEAVSLVFFGFWVFIRGMTPEVVYTEKPMELAFINAILRSDGFPPYDPWLSGYGISYYYFGYVLIAMLTRIAGVASSVAFNLSSALWFSMTAVAAYGLLFELITAWRRNRVTTENVTGGQKSEKSSRLAALLGPLYLLFVSTIEGVLEILHSGGAFWKPGANGLLSSKFWTWLSINDLNKAPVEPFSWIPSRDSGWLWWRGSRVLQDLNMMNEHVEVIDEFPFFTFLLSDMHPHLLALPIVLLGLTLCLNLFLDQGRSYETRNSLINWLRRGSTWFAILILGSLAFINTWDFPIYVGVYCLIIAYFQVQRNGFSKRIVIDFLKNGLVLGILGVVLFLPFYIGFSSQAGGFLPSLEFMTRGVHFWILFGALLFPVFVWLFFQLRGQNLRGVLKRGGKVALVTITALAILMVLYGSLLFSFQTLGPELSASLNPAISMLGVKLSAAGSAFAGVHGNFFGLEVLKETLQRRLQAPGTWLTLGILLILTFGLLSRKEIIDISADEEQGEESVNDRKVNTDHFVLILSLFAIGLTLIPEFFYLRDQFGTRMNTIFKFYFQAWILWGLAAAYATVVLLDQLRKVKAGLFQAAWIIMMLLSLTYPVLMLWNKTDGFSTLEWTLDGNAYIQKYSPDDYNAIQWLQAAPQGIVVEAVGAQYTDYARVATRTGFPTVLGWPGHESQWRGGGAEMGSRYNDIATLYESQDWLETSAIIRMYNIRYIYVGGLEYSSYKVDTGKFDSNLKVVYQNPGVLIYEVPESLLSATP